VAVEAHAGSVDRRLDGEEVLERRDLIVELDLAEVAGDRVLEGRPPARGAAVVELGDEEAPIGEVLPERSRRPPIEDRLRARPAVDDDEEGVAQVGIEGSGAEEGPVELGASVLQ
jgi:hypothetical protein